jgi:ArsR family transcriptional regulator
VEGIERDLRTKLPDEGSYADLEPLMTGDWGGLMARLVADAAATGLEVTVIPAWVGRKGLILSLFDRLIVGPPTPACLPGPSAGTRNRARRLKALGDPTRLAIFEAVAGRPLPVGELARSMNVAQPTVSNHVRILRDAGLIRPAPGEGRRLEADLESFEALVEECRRAAAKCC